MRQHEGHLDVDTMIKVSKLSEIFRKKNPMREIFGVGDVMYNTEQTLNKGKFRVSRLPKLSRK